MPSLFSPSSYPATSPGIRLLPQLGAARAGRRVRLALLAGVGLSFPRSTEVSHVRLFLAFGGGFCKCGGAAVVVVESGKTSPQVEHLTTAATAAIAAIQAGAWFLAWPEAHNASFFKGRCPPGMSANQPGPLSVVAGMSSQKRSLARFHQLICPRPMARYVEVFSISERGERRRFCHARSVIGTVLGRHPEISTIQGDRP